MTKADIKKRIDKILILSRNYCSLISDMCYNRGEGVLRTYSSIEKNYRERTSLKILYDGILFHLSEQDIKITAHYITNEFRYIVKNLSLIGLEEHYNDAYLNKSALGILSKTEEVFSLRLKYRQAIQIIVDLFINPDGMLLL